MDIACSNGILPAATAFSCGQQRKYAELLNGYMSTMKEGGILLLSKQDRENGKCPGSVRVFQGLCWGTLFLVQLCFIRCLETQAANEDHVQQIEGAAEQALELPDFNHSIQVFEFRLFQIPAEEMPVERDVVYEAVEALAEVPEFMGFTVEEDGRQAQVNCWADDMEAENARWSDEFSFPVTFHGCDAEYCQLGDVLIPYREEKPELDGYEPLLLELIDAPQEAYRITDVAWNGAIYTDETGMLCRDALAFGEKLVQDFQVHYVGSAEFSACERWRAAAAYELPLPETHAVDEDTWQLEGGYERLDTADAENKLWKRVVRTVTVAFSLLVLFILVILVAKRKNMGYTKHNCENANRRVDE